MRLTCFICANVKTIKTMKIKSLAFVSVLAATLAWSCGGGEQQKEQVAGSEHTHEHGDHDHGHDHSDHDHGDQENADPNATKFGVMVSADAAISLKEAEQKYLEKGQEEVTVKAAVTDVCQKKGCWMKLDKADGQKVHVNFKDYALFMPFDLAGKEVVVHGKMKTDTVSVAQLKHLAEDAGKSEDEIAQITEPEVRVGLEADGVEIIAQ